MARRVKAGRRATSSKPRGRVAPNVPRAGLKLNGSRYGCGGRKK